MRRRTNSRSHPNTVTRPFTLAALFSFFDGAISLPQCSQVIAQHHTNSTSHVRTAAQEFTRTESPQKFVYTRLNTEIIHCCRIYHLPSTSSSGTPPPATASLAPDTSNPIPACSQRLISPPSILLTQSHSLLLRPRSLISHIPSPRKGKEKVKISHRRPVPLTLPAKVRVKTAADKLSPFWHGGHLNMDNMASKVEVIHLSPIHSLHPTCCLPRS